MHCLPKIHLIDWGSIYPVSNPLFHIFEARYSLLKYSIRGYIHLHIRFLEKGLLTPLSDLTSQTSIYQCQMIRHQALCRE